jgi:hypothetical protein
MPFFLHTKCTVYRGGSKYWPLRVFILSPAFLIYNHQIRDKETTSEPWTHAKIGAGWIFSEKWMTAEERGKKG